MSGLTQSLVIDAVVLAAVLEADVGRHRTIGVLRLIRPMLLVFSIVLLCLTALATHGAELTLEGAAAAAGLLLGILESSMMRVYRLPQSGRTASRAGAGYAAVWILVIGARAAFSWGAAHWFSASLTGWMGRHHVDANAIANSLILMAVAMVLTRTVAMTVRAARAPWGSGTFDEIPDAWHRPAMSVTRYGKAL